MLFNLFTPSYPVVDVNIPEGWWKSDSQLDIDFANNRSFNRKTAYKGRPSELLTYTSPSPKMVYGADGVLGYAPHNLLTYSEDINHGQWTTTNITINSATQFTFTAVDGDFRRILNYLPRSKYELIIELSGSHPGNTFRVELVDGFDGSDSSFVDVTVPASATEFTITADMTAATFSGNLMVVINRHSGGRSITVGSTVTITKMHLRRTPGNATYVPTTSAAVYSLPIDHDPITHAPLGVLIEEQRTNLLTYSQEFDNAAWTKDASSISATNITAPDDTATAELFVSDTNNAIHYLFVGSPPSITSGVTYTGSVFLKKGTGSTAPDWMQLSLSSATFGSIQYANFNLKAGEVGTVGAGATATIEDVGGGWYRCSITATATSTSGGSLLVVFTNNNDALGRVPAYADATTSNVCVWGAQLEAGAFATSYIQTVASQVTRAADQVSIATSAFGFSASIGSFCATGVMTLADNTTNTRYVISLPGPGLPIYMNSGTARAYDGTNIAMGGAVTAKTEFNAAMAYDTNGIAISRDGEVVGTSAFDGSIGSAGDLSFGASGLNGYIKRLTYWNTRKSNPELQGLSA